MSINASVNSTGAFQAHVKWSDRDGLKTTASIFGRETQEQADAEAWEFARVLGYTEPRWWQWWRWSDETPDTVFIGKVLAEHGDATWTHAP